MFIIKTYKYQYFFYKYGIGDKNNNSKCLTSSYKSVKCDKHIILFFNLNSFVFMSKILEYPPLHGN
jgi:hypothetical protein